jgi:hypothetical protein
MKDGRMVEGRCSFRLTLEPRKRIRAQSRALDDRNDTADRPPLRGR